LAAFPSFDDLPLASTYHTGDAMMSDGIAVKFEDFQYADSSWTSTGEATVTNALWAHGSLYELNTNNINARYDFAGSIGTQTQVELLFGEYGGNINIAVNGDFANVGNFMDVHGAVLGGCNITVVSGGFGGDHGELVILGTIENLVIGGQELAVDIRPDDECEPAFEDLPLDTVYVNGDSFTTGGVPVDVGPFKFWDGTIYTSGHVMVENWNLACGTGQELFTNNANVRFDFASVSPVNNLAFEFGEYGGNINVAINGDFRNVPNYRTLDGAVIGGVTFSVTSGGWGNDCGRVECSGVVNKLLLGGQEHFIDCLEFDWMQIDDCEPSYEDLTLGTAYVNGDTFVTDAYKYAVDHFTYSDGTNTASGNVMVENAGNACSANNELHYNNATTLIQRLDGDWMTNLSFKFGEYGGNLNLEINGDFVNFANWIDIDGAVIGGVTVIVDWGGMGGDCGQVSFAGDLQYLRMGGQEYWVDCFKADSTPAPVPGDIDGDGDVDLNDLLTLIAAWGTADAAADLNGDGVVNLDDLLVLLGHFGS
jgi:hypothetical protein